MTKSAAPPKETRTSALLLEHYLNWIKAEGKRRTVKQFAEEIIGMPHTYFNHFMIGRREPGIEMARKFARALNDPRFFDAIDQPRDDPNFKFIQRHWGDAPSDVQRQIAQMFTEYTTEPIPEDGENETPNH
jgi:hypothetical protein